MGSQKNFEVLTHIRKFFPDRDVEFFSWDAGPLSAVAPNFCVVRLAPSKESDAWIYLTCGVSSLGQNERELCEFFILSPTETPIHVESLAMLSYLAIDNSEKLQIGKSVAIGRPWIENSSLDHFLISLPYPFGPDLEWCELSNSQSVRFLWLLPIWSKESAFLYDHGVEALEGKLDKEGIDFLDVTRKSVV